MARALLAPPWQMPTPQALRRIYFQRVLLAGLLAVMAAAVVIYLFLPVLGIAAHDPVRWLAGLWRPQVPEDAARAGALGWLLAVLTGQAITLVFAALWDFIPPRTRPVSKALVFTAILFVVLRLPLSLIPAAVLFALALGVAYRPHPAPPPVP